MAEMLTQQQVAEYLDINPRSVRNLQKAGLPMRRVKGDPRYPWPAGLHWYLRHKLQSALKNATPKREIAARVRKLEAQADREELSLRRDRREVITLDDAQRSMEAVLERIRSVMLTFSGKWAPELVGCETTIDVRKRLEPAIAAAMTALVEAGVPEASEDEGGGEEEDDEEGGE